MINAEIDANLRRVFEEDAASDLPPQLMQLLDRLDSVEVPPSHAPGAGAAGHEGEDDK